MAKAAGEDEPSSEPDAKAAGARGKDAAPKKAETSSEDATPPSDTETLPHLDRILGMVKEGREAELTAAQRGVLRSIRTMTRTEVQEEEQQEGQFREAYLHLLAMKQEEPTQFADQLLGPQGEKLRGFMTWYEENHPGVSLTNPDVPMAKVDDVKREAYQEALGVVDDAIVNVGKHYGLSEQQFAAAYQKSEGRLAEYLIGVADTIAETRVAAALEEKLPKLLAKEREALEAEVQAKWTKNNVVTPRSIETAPSSRQASPPKRQTGNLEEDFAAASSRALERVQEAWTS